MFRAKSEANQELGWAEGPRLQGLASLSAITQYSPCSHLVATRLALEICVVSASIRSRAAGCVAYRWEAVAKFGAGAMVEGVTLATHQFGRHLGELGYQERENEHSLRGLSYHRRSRGHDRAGSGTAAVHYRAGQNLVAEAMEQGKSRIRQGQGEVGFLPTAEQGEEAEGPSELVLSIRLHEVLRIGLGEATKDLCPLPKRL